MKITEFKAYVKTGKALDTDEIHGFMHEMSEEARRVTFRLNTAYHNCLLYTSDAAEDNHFV